MKEELKEINGIMDAPVGVLKVTVYLVLQKLDNEQQNTKEPGRARQLWDAYNTIEKYYVFISPGRAHLLTEEWRNSLRMLCKEALRLLDQVKDKK